MGERPMLWLALLAVPIVIAVSLGAWCAAFRRLHISGRMNWEIVDFVWIASSAVTLYLLVGTLNFETAKGNAQVNLDNYLQHMRRGSELSNAHVATFCVGPTRRILHIRPAEERRFCALNVTAFSFFTRAARRYDLATTVMRETGLNGIPGSIVAGPGGQDAVVANILWKEVRDEMVFQNESAGNVEVWNTQASGLLPFETARGLWFYLFAIIIGLRLAKPVLLIALARK